MEKMMKNKYFIVASLVIVISLIAFFPVIINNESIFILYGDSVEQQYAFLLGFWQKIHDFDFYMFEWSNGFGANTLSYVFYNLFSPFNLLVLPFPKEWIHYLILYLNIFKMVVLAILSCLWLSKISPKNEHAIIGSLMITFSGWCLFYYHYNFLDAFVFYPLILFYTEIYLQDKKKMGLILSVFCLTFVNYYFMYMFVPFLLLYALFRYMIITEKIIIIDTIKEAFIFLFLTLLSIGLAGFVLLPCLKFIIESPRLETSIDLSLFIGKKDLFKIITSLFTPIFSRIEPSLFITADQLIYQGWGGGASLYTSILVIIFMPVLFFFKDLKKRNVLLLFLMIIVLFLLSPYFYKLFQGSMDTRFFYMFTLLSVYIFVEIMDQFSISQWKILLVSFGLSILAFICFILIAKHYQFSDINFLNTQVKYEIVLGLFCLITIFILKYYDTKKLILLVALECLFSLYIFVKYNPPIKSEDFVYETSVNEIVKTIIENDQGFYRVIKNQTNGSLSNDAYINQNNGVSFYTSIYNYKQEQFLNRIKSKWSLPNYDDKYRLYTLTGAKYWFSNDVIENVPLGYHLTDYGYYENDFFVELGYVNNNTLNAEYFFGLPYLLQDRIMQEYVICDESSNTEYNLSDNFEQIIAWAPFEWAGYEFENPISDSIIYIENYGVPDLTVELYFKGDLVRTEKYWQYHYTDIYIGKDEQIDSIIVKGVDVDNFSITSDTYVSFNIYVARKAYETEEKIYLQRKQNSFTNVVFKNDMISADIVINADNSFVVTQIPYDEGWTIKTNGKEIDKVLINGGFIGMNLDKGQYHVEFIYETPWLKEGIILSLLSLTSLFILCKKLKSDQLKFSFSKKR